MRLAIATRADSNVNSMTNYTFPIIKAFCKKWEADFIVLDMKSYILSDDNHDHFRIFEIKNLFNEYDRVISLDADIVITKNCPNLFDIVPEDCIGTIFEDKGTRQEERLKRIQDVQFMFGNVNWNNGYINTGVFITSRMHQDIFTPIDGKVYTKNGSDDVHVGYQIHKSKFKIKELDFRFNHMTMFSEPWNDCSNRFDSYIIHYAGVGIFDHGIMSRSEQIEKDVKKIYGEGAML